jgi:anti-anti-sigma factor
VEKSRSGRERILTAAYELFSRSGVRAVGVDAITELAGVAKMTLYRNFKGKNELAMAFLQQCEERWLTDWVRAETQARATSPAQRLLAIFDIFTEWFERDDFDGSPFITLLLEFEDRDDPVRQACVRHLANVRGYLCELATEAGVAEPERFAAQWHILAHGSIIAAHEGDLDAAVKARELGILLLDRELARDVDRERGRGQEHERLTNLEPIGRGGYLAAASVGHECMVRLTGELDVETAATVAGVIDERCDGPICLDLADLDFVDVAGLRALRGTKDRPIAIAGPSDAVLRLVTMLGWDSDPGVEIRPALAA